MKTTPLFRRLMSLKWIVPLVLLLVQPLVGTVVQVSNALAASPPTGTIQGTIWIANEDGNSITVIDASSNQVLTTLTGIEGPHNLQVAPDGRTVWAVSGHDSLALLIDASTYNVLGTVPTGAHPAHIVVTPNGRTAYVTNADDNTVTAIDVDSLQTVTTIPVGEYPHGLRPSPDGRWLYVANVNSGTLSVVDTSNNTSVADIEVGQRPIQVAFAPDGAFVYVSLNQENALGKVDVATRALVGKVDVGSGPVQVFVTPDNREVLVANQGTESDPGTTISIVDVATFSVIKTVEVGTGPHGIVVEPSGRYAYITNIYGNDVAVLDLDTQEVVATVPTDSSPNGISFSPLAASAAPASEIALAVTTSGGAADNHAAHHPATEATATPEAETAAGSEAGSMGAMGSSDAQPTMQGMSDMMASMMTMPMSDEMMALMQQMQGMMNMMLTMPMSDQATSDTLQSMSDMMDTMLSMDMSDALRSQMEKMQGMMSMMMNPGSANTGGMSGMDMGSSGTSSSMGMGAASTTGHGMEPISSAGVPPATQNVGGQPLDYTLDNGVKVFEITAEPVLWKILDDVTVTAWTYNGTIPGPMIRVTEGDQVRIIVHNQLPEATSIHWHGIQVPNNMDGVPGVTQAVIQPGETFTYEFTARPAGTFMYHSHVDSDTQIGLGLYAPFIIDPATPQTPAVDVDQTLMLSEWRVVDGQTFAAMPMAGAEPNYFTINGKAYPATQTINVQRGQRVRLRLVNIGQFVHPMHLHGMPFQIVATDGYPVPEAAQLTKDTVSIAPGERYDIEFTATELGQWMLHCHIPHHLTNDGVEPGGLMLMVNVSQ